ncbi:MAG: glycosyltransferase family 4 protein [Bacteroidota bacterium]
MRVLMFGWEFPPHISGGLGTASFGLTKGLSKIPDLDIRFVVPKVYGDEERSRMELVGANEVEISRRLINFEGFLKEIEYLEVDSMLIPYTGPEEYERKMKKAEFEGKTFIHTSFRGKIEFTGTYGENLFQEIANYAIVASVLGERNDFELIHAHDWLTYPAGIAAKNVSGKPLVIHVHATDFDRSGGSVNPAIFEIEKKGMEAADRIIAVSNFTRNTIIEKYGVDPSKVITVHNAVDPVDTSESDFRPKSVEEKIVTFLGRVTMQKGPEYFVEAAYKVLQKMDNVRFVMAGSGELLHRMVARAASLGIADRFHFTGFLKGSEVYQMFSLSDVYVMPSVSEPFGISPLEAMQSNVPTIISHQSGVSEILVHALKVDFWDVDALADSIYAILNYSALSEMFKKYGKQEVENLKWENSALEVNKVYNAVT